MIGARINEPQALAAFRRRVSQTDCVTICPANTRIAVDMHFVGIAEPGFTQRRPGGLRVVCDYKLNIMDFNIGPAGIAAQVKHKQIHTALLCLRVRRTG